MEEQDVLTRRIAAQLAERKRRMDQMEEWERPARRIPMWTIATVLAAAACVVLVVLQYPVPSGNDGSGGIVTELTRGTGESIEEALEAGRYEDALMAIDSVLQQKDSAIAALKGMEQDEETAYELMDAQQKQRELADLKKKLLKEMKK